MEDFDNLIGDIHKELVNFKKEAQSNPEIKPDGELDLYLIDNLFPVLFPALEELSKEVERYQTKGNQIDEFIRQRFNPLLFLSQYLMRNNPKYNPEKYENNEFRNFSEQIRKQKTLDAVRKDLFELYNKVCTENKANSLQLLTIKIIDAIIKKFDEGLNMNGEINKQFHILPKIIDFKENKKEIPVEVFHEEFYSLIVKNNNIKDKAIREQLFPALGIQYE